jgi:phosphorylcholine metabolism protein LicD
MKKRETRRREEESSLADVTVEQKQIEKEVQKFHLDSRWQNSFAKFVASSLRICLPKEQKQERQQTQISELLQDHA